MRQKLLLLLLLLTAWGARAQAPTWQSTLSSTAVDVRAVAMNTNGDVFVTGSYTGSVTFGSNTLNSTGGSDVFVAKWAAGASTWAWGASAGGGTAGDGGDANDFGNAIAINGNRIYVTGQYRASTFSTGAGTLTNAGGYDMFLAKFTDNTTSASASGLLGSSGGASQEYAYGVDVNPNTGNVYVTGYFGSNTSPNATISGTALASGGSADVYVAKYFDNGTTLSNGGAIRAGGTSGEISTCIALNGNTIYIAGRFNSGGTGTAVFGSTTLNNGGGNDIFVARFSDTTPGSTGGLTVQNALRGGGDQSEGAQGIVVSSGSIYVTGYFTSASSVIAGSTLGNAGGSDLFLAKYTDTGSALSNGYAIGIGGSNDEDILDASTGADIDVSGTNVYVTSDYTTSATIAGTALTSAGGSDVFVAKFTDNGAGFTNGGAVSGGGAGTDRSTSIAVNGTQGVAGGAFVAPATFGSTTLSSGTAFAGRLSFAAPPTVTTAAASTITSTSAVLGGNVTADGGATVTDRGVVYSTSNTTPTTSDTKDANGSGTGSFSETIGSLAPGTRYYVRAYAINSVGTGYGSPANFTTPPNAPVVTAPANGSLVNTATPTYTGTAQANSTVTVYVDGAALGTTTASGSGIWSLAQPSALSQGSHTVYASASINGSGQSANSNTNTFTVDTVAPTVSITSSAGGNGGTTATTPIPFTVTFSESVTGFVQGDLNVSGGTISGFSGSGTTYTFNVTPSGSGSTVAVNVAANTAQDAAGNGNTAASQYSLTYQQPLVASAQAVTVQLDAFGNGTLTASSVNNNSSGSGTLTYTIQKIAFGYIPESTTPLTLTTPNGANFTQIRFASYGTPNNTNGNYSLGSCNAANSLAAAQNAYVGRNSGSMYASNTDTRNNPVLGDPCGGTPKALAVQAGYSADAASLNYNCTEAGKTQYVLLTVTNGTSTSTSVAQVTVNAPPTATISSVSPTSAQRGATVTVAGTNLSGVSSVTVNGAAATVSNSTANGFTFVVPSTSTFGTGSILVATPCAQTLTNTFTVVSPALTATVSTTSSSPTSTSPLPFSVSFSQSVGTTFTASDVTVTGGTLTSGSLSGSGAGPYTFTVTPSGAGTVTVSLAANVANDANNTGNSASNSVSVQYQAPTITVAPASLPIGTQNTAYSQNLSASGGTAPYTFVITARALPPGLTLTSAGVLSGTPTASGTFNFTITATDASAAPGPYSGSRDYSLVINAQPVTAAPVVTTPANNSFSNNRSVTVTGTAPAGSTVAVYIGANLAGTTTATATGTFSYLIPGTAPDGTYVVSATAQSSGSAVSASSNGNTFTIDGVAPTVTLSSATVASGNSTSTSPVSFTATFNEPVTGFTSSGITVTNGTVTSGPTAGSGNTYTFQITPSRAGNVTVTVQANAAQDRASNNNTASSQYAFTFAVPTITVAPATLPNGTQGTAYSQVLSASGGTAPYTFAITAGALPAGLSLTSGTITGTPTVNGTFNFTVTATDASAAPGPYSGSRSYTLLINTQPVTAAPIVTAPANGSLLNTTSPTYQGTAAANSTVTVYVDGSSIGTTTASSAGSFSLAQPTALAQGSHTVYATAQTSGNSVSANSNTNTFSVDTVRPTVAITSTAGASGSSTSTTPLPFTVTFSEGVTGFVAGSVTVSNGTIAGFSGSGTTYTFTVTPTTAGTATTVNVAANVAQDQAGNGNTAATQYSLTYVVPVTATTWTGAVSTDWFTAGNWTAGVPTSTVDATIPGGLTTYPLLTTGTAFTQALTISFGGLLSQTGGLLDVRGNLTDNGRFGPSGGTVSLGFSSRATIGGNNAIRFWNLDVQANGATLNMAGNTTVRRVLTLIGSFSTQGNSFTLESNATGDALVVNSGGVVTGTATVQRYIDPSVNAGLGARHYSAPVSNTTVADLATSGYSPVLNPAFNTADKPAQVRPFPTVFGYDQSRLTLVNTLPTFDKGFFSPTSFSDPLRVGQGYVVNIASTELVDFVGTLNNGDVTTNMVSNRDTYVNDGGWQLVGNPYPAPLDYGQVADADRNGLDASLYVYSSTSQYNGQYRAYVRGVGGNSVVPSGQGFFVRVSSGRTAGSLTLRNAYRLTAPNATTFQRTAAETRPLVQLTLKGTGSASDDAYVYFENGATNALDAQFDAVKLPNTTGLNLSTSITGQQLAIDGRPELGKAQQVVPLAVGVPTVGTYTFTTAQLLNLANVPVYLRDLQLGTVTDLRLQPSYQFTVTNAAALITGRFELVFSPQQALATVPAALAQQVALYPNPAKKAAFVELPASLGRQAVTATLVDALGRQVRTVQLPAQGSVAHPLDLSDLATGVYALRLSTSAGVVVKKLVVE